MCQFCDFQDSAQLTGQKGVAPASAPGFSAMPVLAESPFDATVIGNIADSGNRNINAHIYGTMWQRGQTVTYNFPNSVNFYSNYPHSGDFFSPATLQQATAARSILQGPAGIQGLPTAGTAFTYGSYTAVSGLLIDEVAPGTLSDIPIANLGILDGQEITTARVVDFPRLDQRRDGGDIFFGYANPQLQSPVPGTYAWATVIHEIGHAFGLKHSHANDHGPFRVAMESAISSVEYSIMSYASYPGTNSIGTYTNETYGYPQTLMMYDIATLQYLYGANFATNNTDTVYAFNPTTGEMSVNGVGQGAPGQGNGGSSNRIFLTIWDGGGVDTYDLSNYTTDLSLNLTPGLYSVFSQAQLANLGQGHFARGNVFNALQYQGNIASLIENATGGSGNDTIIGNEASNVLRGGGGNDTLNGLGGNDMLFGGDGNDTLYGGGGADSLYGEAGNDFLAAFGSSSTVLDGGAGDDTLYGGPGNDYMIGGAGKDVMVGLGGIDSMFGGAGDDYIVAGDGPGSVLDGGAGANALWGGSGNDYAVGGEGNDIIVMGAGSDYLFGLDGNDSLYGGAGTDYIYGNAGNDFIYTDDIGQSFTDYVYIGLGTGVDTVADFKASGTGADVVVISGGLFSSFAQVQTKLSQVGVYTVISLSATDQLYLYNVQPFELGSSNFIFL